MANYNIFFKHGTAEKFATITKDPNTFYLVGSDLYLGNVKISNAADLSALATRVGTAEELLTKLNNDNTVTGSIKQQIKAAIEALDGSATIASVDNHVVTIKAGITEADGVVSNSSGTDITLAAIAHSGNASDVNITDSDDNFEATTVEEALAELADAVADTQSAGEIILAHENGSLTYTLYQGAQDNDHKIGEINIPSDLVATAGSLYTATAQDTGLTEGNLYIKMTVANGDPFYIPVQDLVDVYIGSGDQTTPPTTGVKINVVNGVISATVMTLDGSKLDAGSVAKAALASGVQSSLGLADSAVQTIAEGATNGTVAVDGTDVAVHGLGSAAYTASTAYDAAGSAAAVLGDSTNDTASTKTVEGLVKKTDATNTFIGSIPVKGGTGADANDPVASTIVGYVDLKAAAAVDALDSNATIASKSGNIVTLKARINQVDGVISNAPAADYADIALSSVASTGAAVNVSIADSGNLITSSDVEGALQEIAGNVSTLNATLQWVEF